MIQLTLTLKMTTAQVVETSVTVNNNSPIQDYVHPDDQTQPFEMTPGFKPFTIIIIIIKHLFVKVVIVISLLRLNELRYKCSFSLMFFGVATKHSII